MNYRNKNDKIFENKNRVSYYLGSLDSHNSLIYIASRNLHPNIIIVDESFKHKKFNGNDAIDYYISEMNTYYNMFKQSKPGKIKFLFIPGDVNTPFLIPVLCKSRPVYKNGFNVLLPYNIPRHWDPIKDVKKYEINPFYKKKNICIWRGASTGKQKRLPLIYNYFNEIRQSNSIFIDVGFTNFTNDYIGIKSKRFLKNRMSMSELLDCKYLISVEGNDVATNLKWILASQSVCIKPPSLTSSWLMEDKLVQWVHYIPVNDDFSDLKIKLNWCNNNPKKCEIIIKAANDYIKRFDDIKNEQKIIFTILNEYNKKVKFV
jgi:hypothetical protein